MYPGMRLSPLSFSISSLPVRKVLPDWNRLSSDLCCWAPWWLFFLERRRTLPMSSEPSAKAWYELFQALLSVPPMVALRVGWWGTRG